MPTLLQKGSLAIITAVALAGGTAAVANADCDHGWHRGWHHGWHHKWGGPYAYYPGDCFVRRSVYINRWGERVVRSVRVAINQPDV